jgi:DNA-binding transcriptional ArsR family regulator
MSRPAVSQHLGVLERAGLIERTAEAQWRRVTLRTQPLDEVSAWINRHRADWNERFDLLEERLRDLKGASDA